MDERNEYVISNIVKELYFSLSVVFGWSGNPKVIREQAYEIFDKRLREFTPTQLDDPDYLHLKNLIQQWRNLVEVPTTHSMPKAQGPE